MGYCVGNLVHDLLEGFLLFRGPLEIKVFWTKFIIFSLSLLFPLNLREKFVLV